LDGTVYAGNTPADPMLQGALRFLATPLADRVSTFYTAKGSGVTVELSGTADECGVGGESSVGAGVDRGSCSGTGEGSREALSQGVRSDVPSGSLVWRTEPSMALRECW